MMRFPWWTKPADRHPEFDRGWWWGFACGAVPPAAVSVLNRFSYDDGLKVGMWVRAALGL